MLKIRTEEEGKTFEAFVKMVISDDDLNLIGLGVAGNLSTTRAIFGSLYDYNNSNVSFHNEEDDDYFWLRTTRSYRRIEELNGKVSHSFFLPTMAIEKEYEADLQKAKQEEVELPPRIIIAKKKDIEREIGLFLANTYGLPKTDEWVNKYVSLLPRKKLERLNVRTTDLMGADWQDLEAYKIHSMYESEVLDYVDSAIRMGVLNPITDNESKAVFEEGMTTEEYLRMNADTLSAHIDKYMKPKYDGSYFLESVGSTKRTSLPAQARATMGSLEVLKDENSVFLVGDLGSGKTQMALSTAFSMMKEREKTGADDGLRVLIVAPSIIVPKWANSEIPEILGNKVANTIILNSTEDAIHYAQKVKAGHKVKKGTIEFVLVSTDRMKLGASGYVLGAKWNRHSSTWHCPDCNEAIISPHATEEEPDMLASWRDAVEEPYEAPEKHHYEWAIKGKNMMPNGLPKAYVTRWSKNIRRFVCHNCAITEERDNGTVKVLQSNHSLVRPALRSRGETKFRPRWMIAQIFQRMIPNHFHLGIYDEIQQMKASNSGRGLSFHKLLKTTRKNMFLTATPTNGEASSIQSVLWRSDPQSLLDEGFDHQTSEIAWATKYGVVEKVTSRKDEGVVGITTNRRNDRVVIKAKPGISPRLTTRHLLHKSIFLDLSDLGLPLVKKEEIPVIIPLKDDHYRAYQYFARSLYETAMEYQSEMGQGAWANYNPATLNYADQPQLDFEITFKNKDGETKGIVRSEKFPDDYMTAKEQKLIEIVRENLREGRGCIVYNHFTGQYKQNERLQKLLSEHGIESEILNTNVSSAKRFDWLEKQKQIGTKVLIMNMSLVQVGLDLLDWSTIIYYQLNDDVNVLRQAGGRNWRIGQNRNCRIYYLVNEDTQQMRQFTRLMSRRVEALLVEGRLSRSDSLVEFAQNTESQLARDLTHSLQANELIEKWKTTAEKDVDQNLELVDESELEERIGRAFEVLTAETRRLCGISEEDWKEQSLDSPIELNTDLSEDETVEVDLFNFEDFIVVEEVKVKRSKDTVDQFAFDI